MQYKTPANKLLEKLLLPQELAEMIGSTVATLATQRCNGTNQIPYVKIGRSVRYRLSDIEKYLENQTYLHTHLKAEESN